MTDIVSIDLDDDEQVERLARLRYEKSWIEDWPNLSAFGRSTHLRYMRDALREFAHPPKPDEPTGLGAVVWDHKRQTKAVRADQRGSYKWVTRGIWRTWDDLDVRSEADILSHGLTEDGAER